MPKRGGSTVLTLRVPDDVDRRIQQEARRTRRTKSAVMRDALQHAFGDAPPPEDPAREARRQSLLVSGRASEADAIAFAEHAGDPRGWR